MPHLVVAPDKFRGTASAAEICATVAAAALRAGWTADAVPMSDGGEGLLEVVGGEVRTTEVTGPLGDSVTAAWHLVQTGEAAGPTAVIEMATAAGRALVPHPNDDDPVRASTTGVGQLLLAAKEAGARAIIVGCGGSATTDGGRGAVQVVGTPSALAGIELTVACDVTTAFGEAARVFGPQKGATPEQVEFLTQRLVKVAKRYRRQFGVDVTGLDGAGAAGGLAGGLAALGARLAPGFDLVSALNHLPERIDGADLVVTGEGHLDPPSFAGKVPGGILRLVAGRCPVLCVVGDADPEVLDSLPQGIEVVSLTALAGSTRAHGETLALLDQFISEALPRFCP
ncbi:MAG TPA: glycerate kinase [Acidimicrobiales bacterium]|jgi:glycerate kinase